MSEAPSAKVRPTAVEQLAEKILREWAIRYGTRALEVRIDYHEGKPVRIGIERNQIVETLK